MGKIIIRDKLKFRIFPKILCISYCCSVEKRKIGSGWYLRLLTFKILYCIIIIWKNRKQITFNTNGNCKEW